MPVSRHAVSQKTLKFRPTVFHTLLAQPSPLLGGTPRTFPVFPQWCTRYLSIYFSNTSMTCAHNEHNKHSRKTVPIIFHTRSIVTTAPDSLSKWRAPQLNNDLNQSGFSPHTISELKFFRCHHFYKKCLYRCAWNLYRYKTLWEPPTLNQALANQRGPWQLQRPLVLALPSDNVPPTR
jgi:hypothetical protein